MRRESTEYALTHWRYGPTHAERLCASLLVHEGYSDVSPQAPLGGPDGRKDITCVRGGTRYVAACYFASSKVPFAQVRRKFEHDLQGAAANSAIGFVFFSNQHLRLGEIAELERTAMDAGCTAVICPREWIQSRLDSVRGYGLRLEFLKIAMTEEEQYAFWTEWKTDLAEVVRRQSDEFAALRERVDAYIVERLQKLLDVKGELAFLLGMLVHALPLIRDAMSSKGMDRFFASNRNSFETIRDEYLQYVEGDANLGTLDKERRHRTIQTWGSLIQSACKLFMNNEHENCDGIRSALLAAVEQLDPGAPDFKDMTVKAIMDAFMKRFWDQREAYVKLELLNTAVREINKLIEAQRQQQVVQAGGQQLGVGCVADSGNGTN